MNKQEFQQTIKNMKPPKFFTAITLGGLMRQALKKQKATLYIILASLMNQRNL